VLAIKQVSSYQNPLIFADALVASVQKLQPLHAWAGDGLMMFLLCHSRSPHQLKHARHRTCIVLNRYRSVLIKVKSNTWMQLTVRPQTSELIPSLINAAGNTHSPEHARVQGARPPSGLWHPPQVLPRFIANLRNLWCNATAQVR
jgi:hypothetical protein